MTVNDAKLPQGTPDEHPCAQNPDAGKPACHEWPRIPLHLIDDYRCGLERGHAGDHRAISKERLRWHDEPESQTEQPKDTTRPLGKPGHYGDCTAEIFVRGTYCKGCGRFIMDEQPKDVPANNRDAEKGADASVASEYPSAIPAQRTSNPAEAGASGDTRRCPYHGTTLAECAERSETVHGFPKGVHPCTVMLNRAEQALHRSDVSMEQFVAALHAYEARRHEGPGNAMMAALSSLGIGVQSGG